MKNYIVIATDENDKVLCLLGCDEKVISDYIKRLIFDAEVKIHFVPIKKFETCGMVLLSNSDVERVHMNCYKTLNDFHQEVSELMKKLGIEKVEVVEKNV